MQDLDIPPQPSEQRPPAKEMPPEYPLQLAEAIVSRADDDVALLVDFLQKLGRKPVADPPPLPDPLAVSLMKLAAALRVSRWEAAGLTPFLHQAPPCADGVFEDLCHHPDGGDAQAYPAARVAAQVLGSYLAEMAWQRPGQHAADVVVNSVDGTDLVDPVAELLWQFRNLVHKGEKLATAAPLGGDDPAPDQLGQG